MNQTSQMGLTVDQVRVMRVVFSTFDMGYDTDTDPDMIRIIVSLDIRKERKTTIDDLTSMGWIKVVSSKPTKTVDGNEYVLISPTLAGMIMCKMMFY